MIRRLNIQRAVTRNVLCAATAAAADVTVAAGGATTSTAGSGSNPTLPETFCTAVGLPPGVTVAKIGYSTDGINESSPAKLFWAVQ